MIRIDHLTLPALLMAMATAAAAQEAAPPTPIQETPLWQTVTDQPSVMAEDPDAVAEAASALTDPAAPAFWSPGEGLAFESGEEIYQYLCRDCHQYDGSGAVGAGRYPALAGNANLEYGDYPVMLVVNGHKGMPPLGGMLGNEQVVAVVTYIQTSFGNSYTEHPTVDSVAAIRPEDQAAPEGGGGGN